MKTDEAILSSVIEELTYLEFNNSKYDTKLIFKPHIKWHRIDIWIIDEYIHIHLSVANPLPGISSWCKTEKKTKKISLFETKDLVKDIDDFIREHIPFFTDPT